MSYDFPDLTIHKLFATRADLYRTVYMHPKVKVGMESNASIKLIICLYANSSLPCQSLSSFTRRTLFFFYF